MVLVAALAQRPDLSGQPDVIQSKIGIFDIDRASDGEGFRIRYRPSAPAPDLLAYGVESRLSFGDPLPVSAKLIGALTPAGPGAVAVRCDSLPAAIAVYSLGHGEVVNSTAVNEDL